MESSNNEFKLKLKVSAIRFKKLDPRAVVPEFKTFGSAGLDLVAIEDAVIWSGCTVRVRTGLAWSVPFGVVGRIVPRSSLYAKGLDCDGTIDSDYRGEIVVQLRYLDPDNAKYFVRAGDRVAQLIPTSVMTLPVLEVQELDQTSRGDGGFGSTGK